MDRLLKELRTSELDRRKFLALSSAGAAALVFGQGPYTTKELASPAFTTDPFKLGVASGDPLPDSVVLWTRIAPDPLAEGGAGGMPYAKVAVRWEISEYENFRKLTDTGTEIAYPELAHSVP